VAQEDVEHSSYHHHHHCLFITVDLEYFKSDAAKEN
jgi:plasmid rolling circle replication initiator protein Rep